MADIRISRTDLAAIIRGARAIEGSTNRFPIQTLRVLGTQVERALAAAVASIESVAADLRVFDPEQQRRLRRGLETVEGAAAGARAAVTVAATIPDPRFKALALVAGAVYGAAQGANLEDVRLQLARVRNEVRRERAAIDLEVRAIDQRLDRLRAARRRTGSLG